MAQKRAPGRGRVAWVAMLAASCLPLTLPIRGTAQDARPRPAAPQDAITAILDAFRSFRVVSFPGGHTDANESQAVPAASGDSPCRAERPTVTSKNRRTEDPKATTRDSRNVPCSCAHQERLTTFSRPLAAAQAAGRRPTAGVRARQ
jgi:hypothetical protein